MLEDPGQYYKQALLNIKAKGWKDDQVTEAISLYGSSFMNRLHKRFKPIMECLTRLKLFRTYSYMRNYQKGAFLHVHSDREGCEISATITLGFDSKTIWPIYIKDYDENIVMTKLAPGDGMIYRGADLLHWRPTFKGNQHVQIFLHYVEQGGPNAWCKDDKVKVKPSG